MKYLLFFLSMLPGLVGAQALRDMNFSHWYDPAAPVKMTLRSVRGTSEWRCYFGLQIRDSSASVDVEWQVRKSLYERETVSVPESNVDVREKSNLEGTVTTPFTEDLRFLVAVVTMSGTQEKYTFFTPLEPKYPETFTPIVNGRPLTETFAVSGSEISFESRTISVSYYNDDFPTAPLASSETLGKVARSMTVDSVFTMSSPVILSKPGLYLFQGDTTSAEGVALRVEEDYPRLKKIKSIGEPLIYICTSQEYNRVLNAKGDKKAFDKVILSITKDSERAKQFMRSYYRRVELANSYFTSYKEGWKTDRGMIFIIFGSPDEVLRLGDREVWNYKRPEYKVNFEFVKSPSIFDPNNYVLIRNKKYRDTWYQVIDLWRNARF